MTAPLGESELEGPLIDVLSEFFGQVTADDIIRRINTAAHDVETEWAGRANRAAYVGQAIREAAYRAVHDVLSQEYITVRGDIP